MSLPLQPATTSGLSAPSDWVQRWAQLIRPGGKVLDVACGQGRHMRYLAQRGFAMTGLDRDAQAVAQSRAFGHALQADLEVGPWPLLQTNGEPLGFDAVVVTNYLWRPLLPTLTHSLATGGVLIYETFGAGQQTIGRPARPEFLLHPGELLSAFASLRVVAFEDGFLAPPARFVQRLVAVRASAGPVDPATPEPARYPLWLE